MRGDFTRFTFDPAKHYSRVLFQQGRVQLDADLNALSDIMRYHLRTLTRHLIGPHAGPAGEECGFELITAETIDVEDRIDALELDPERRKLLKSELGKKGQPGKHNILIAPGSYYVNGILVRNERAILYTEQPGYPYSGTLTLDELNKIGNRGFLVYLDVWEEHVTYLDDDLIREVSLGGPDTCSRAKVVWQVKVLPAPDGAKDFDATAIETLPASGNARLRARARLDKVPTELCVIPPESRYRGAENQLYRVEVHRGSTASGEGATFKWSRDNGSVVFPIRKFANGSATLEHLGRDERQSLVEGDWVEIIDDDMMMRGEAGPLAEVTKIERDDLKVTLEIAPGPVAAPNYDSSTPTAKHAVLRRWDHKGDHALGGALAIEGHADGEVGKQTWIELEDGVQVWFSSNATYLSGDYWLIPARTATGDVEWPPELDATGRPKMVDGNPLGAARFPDGVHHAYAPLLLRAVAGGKVSNDLTDARCGFAIQPCVK